MLLKPLTYMNLSGRAVASAMSYYKLALDDLLVVVDDIALPCGTIRLRAAGSAGGHNGLLDIQAMIGHFRDGGQAARGLCPAGIGVDPPGRVPRRRMF